MGFLHVELTTRCTLRCHACARTQHIDKIPQVDLDAAIFESLVKNTDSIKTLLLCGDHGDPIYHPQFHELISIVKKYKPEWQIIIATNGSHRKEAWWIKTAELLSEQDIIFWGIDGYKENSQIYRVNADWQSIQTGITTVQKFGRCLQIWQWILFNYNLDHLLDGIELARQLKMDFFEIVFSPRHGGDEHRFQNHTTHQQLLEILKRENISTV